ncbi:hypothetical protein TrLO_g4672 [Triparma laevis f. longispina]|uniref:Kinesin-like protein n=1 Tax=Triparma laevis f. longispina TaxID=1714387 RepID=A0A9W7DNB0_9STRA|nr:hypothetical protein TrLO_g4672 [Triparma laevis f. longispina]
MSDFLPSNDDSAAWKAKLIDYYKQNAPAKVRMVNDAMMAKYAGKYDSLYGNLIKKYGPLGQPSAPASATGHGGGNKKTISDFSNEFVNLVNKATPCLPARSVTSVVEGKASDSANGLETSTFTVCARVRPLLPPEQGQGGEMFAAVVAGDRIEPTKTIAYTEQMLLCTPKVSIMGKPKLEESKFDFDYVFGSDSNNSDIYQLTTLPLVKRALDGQVGVVFAYGQTGSGKTHTMNGIMDELIKSSLFSDQTEVSLSYLEILGQDIRDCLGSGGSNVKPVAIGEALDGRILTRNLTNHVCADPEALTVLVEKAKSQRSTAATSRNDTSSRSHGCGILTIKDIETGIEGKLYIIDLAGSERAADSKNHDKVRMAETKAINSSLSALKECIRARTMASQPGNGGIHVPYRRSKLTLLMKDVFDIGCTRLCSTVVITACSPLAMDISHTGSTLKYSAPLRVAMAASAGKKLPRDPLDPALWNADQTVEYLQKTHPNLPSPDKFLGGLTGVHLCALPEKEFYTRTKNCGGTVEVAKEVYLAIWSLISDAKTRRRRPDGSIITAEDEEKERLQLIADKEEKARVWVEREKHLKREF